jgi:hypothetical protein
MPGARLAVVPLLLMLSGCADPIPIDGVWMRGGVSGDHTGVIYLQLQLEGSHILGRACRVDGGHRVFTDLPVEGRYPWLSFEYGARRVLARVESEGFIRAQFPIRDDYVQEWSFTRTAPSAYTQCAAAAP